MCPIEKVTLWVVHGVPHRDGYSIWVIHGVPHREGFSVDAHGVIPHRESYSMHGWFKVCPICGASFIY